MHHPNDCCYAPSQVDPLFQHQSAAYDEGGTAELRLNQLNTVDETGELILDSSTPVMQTHSRPPVHLVDVTKMMPQILRVQPKGIAQLQLCASLQTFRFTGWDPSADEVGVARVCVCFSRSHLARVLYPSSRGVCRLLITRTAI